MTYIQSVTSGEVDKATIRRRRRPMTTFGSRKVHRTNKVTVGGASGGDHDADDDLCVMEEDSDCYPVKGQPGMFYKVGAQLDTFSL